MAALTWDAMFKSRRAAILADGGGGLFDSVAVWRPAEVGCPVPLLTIAGSSKLFGTWAKMLSAIFNRAKSCKHGRHSILYNVYIHEHLFYFVDTCVTRLENTP